MGMGLRLAAFGRRSSAIKRSAECVVMNDTRHITYYSFYKRGQGNYIFFKKNKLLFTARYDSKNNSRCLGHKGENGYAVIYRFRST